MTALVTGAAGFLGSHIVDGLLARGEHVRVLVRASSDLTYLSTLSQVELVRGDITSAADVGAALLGIDTVYHSAARVSDFGTRKDFVAANVTATDHLLAASLRQGVSRFVFVSSPSVVMTGGDQAGVDESIPYPSRYLNLYSETKAEAERRVLRANGPALITCAIRPRAVWGPRDRTGWFPKIFKQLAAGRLPDMSGGRSVLACLSYCTDAAEACIRAGHAADVGGKAYFVCDPTPVDVWAFARLVVTRFGLSPITRTVRPQVVRGLARGLDAFWALSGKSHRSAPPLSLYAASLLTCTGTYDVSRARADLDFAPRVDVESGLTQLADWIDELGGIEAFTRHA